MSFEILEHEFGEAVIKVFGTGGAGGNAVSNMVRKGLVGAELICANTDAKALQRTGASRLIQLGKTGLGAGGRPEVGRQAALDEADKIRAALSGAHMVFITAGMGGGTGTGSAPVVAQIAKELNILTIAIVTKPFNYEGTRRMRYALEGLDELIKNVDSVMVIANDRVYDILPPNTSMPDCYLAVDDVLYGAVSSIVDIIEKPGLQNVDFQDVCTVMSETKGRAMLGFATAGGDQRAQQATEKALNSPLLDGAKISDAKGVIVNISYHPESAVTIQETSLIMNMINEYTNEDSLVIQGLVPDENLGRDLRVTIIATGLEYDHAQILPVKSTSVASTITTQNHGLNIKTEAKISGPVIDSPAPTNVPVISTTPIQQSNNMIREEMLSAPQQNVNEINHMNHLQSVHHQHVQNVNIPQTGQPIPSQNVSLNVNNNAQIEDKKAFFSFNNPANKIEGVDYRGIDIPAFIRRMKS